MTESVNSFKQGLDNVGTTAIDLEEALTRGEAEKNGYHYVIELKVADGKEAAERATDEAMRQIREKGYADKYAKDVGQGATLIAMAVDRTKRRVAGWRIEWVHLKALRFVLTKPLILCLLLLKQTH